MGECLIYIHSHVVLFSLSCLLKGSCQGETTPQHRVRGIKERGDDADVLFLSTADTQAGVRIQLSPCTNDVRIYSLSFLQLQSVIIIFIFKTNNNSTVVDCTEKYTNSVIGDRASGMENRMNLEGGGQVHQCLTTTSTTSHEIHLPDQKSKQLTLNAHKDEHFQQHH